MEVKKLSWLLRALLALAALALLWQLRLALYALRSSAYIMMTDPHDVTFHIRCFLCDLFIFLAVAGPLPALAAAWGICRQAGRGRGFYQEKRLRLLGLLAAVETALLAAADVMMLSFRVDRLGGGFLWGLPRLLDGTMLLYLGLTLGCAAVTVILFALGRSAQRAAALADENALAI